MLIGQTNVAIDVSREGIERAGECRAVVWGYWERAGSQRRRGIYPTLCELKSPCAEELNSIVGNAFRMAYAAQLQRQPTFHDVIASQLQDKSATNQIISWPKQIPGSVTDNMETNVTSSSPTLLLHKSAPPSSIPGLRSYHTHTHTHGHSDSTHSTPSSEESNSPTELNSYKRLGDKPPLIKRLAMGLANTPPEEDHSPLVEPLADILPPQSIVRDNTVKHIEIDNNRLSQSSPSSTETELKSKRISQISSSSSSVSGTAPTDSSTPPPPLPPERTDSLTNKPEEGELRTAPWFQAGIPREITLEILGQEPVGAFMVWESTSKPGCLALMFQPFYCSREITLEVLGQESMGVFMQTELLRMNFSTILLFQGDYTRNTATGACGGVHGLEEHKQTGLLGMNKYWDRRVWECSWSGRALANRTASHEFFNHFTKYWDRRVWECSWSGRALANRTASHEFFNHFTEPVGAFMVWESTSKPGCLALMFQPFYCSREITLEVLGQESMGVFMGDYTRSTGTAACGGVHGQGEYKQTGLLGMNVSTILLFQGDYTRSTGTGEYGSVHGACGGVHGQGEYKQTGLLGMNISTILLFQGDYTRSTGTGEYGSVHEVLGQEPVGAFMVRESTSKPGCFALSLRVPREFQPLGIAHYLILRTNKGYKIKGFTKEFSTLTALITHHSVMPELLPCPLSLSRYNPSFVKSDSNRDFADIDSDPDYNTLADFRKMMADLNV
ncbi:hypothetical protein J6590_003021 [Homalodisca vitripennis]|nr:hypothetical protein J6590_003021 [Homalodisca vitripennis]